MEGAGKRVLITGASAGIGAALARELAGRGYDLALSARRADRLERLAEECRARGVRAEVLPADLGEPDGPSRLADELLDRCGRLDVLVNNAGFGLHSAFAEADPALIRRQLEVNLVAPLLLTRFLLPLLVERRGVVINVGSSITAVANSALGAYGATKAGLAYWNDALRRELRPHGVRVCLVEPGPVKTEFLSALQTLAPPGERPDAILNAPRPWMTAEVDDVARRIASLIRRPRRRLSVRRRVVWPFRAMGGLFQVVPGLGDWAVGALTGPAKGKQPREGAAEARR